MLRCSGCQSASDDTFGEELGWKVLGHFDEVLGCFEEVVKCFGEVLKRFGEVLKGLGKVPDTSGRC